MSAKHSPGPWAVSVERDTGDGGRRIYVSAVGPHSLTVCRVTPIIEGSRWRWAEEDMSDDWQRYSMANASLIAASPRLLSALRGLLEAVQRSVCLGSGPAQHEAIEAIREAEGRQ